MYLEVSVGDMHGVLYLYVLNGNECAHSNESIKTVDITITIVIFSVGKQRFVHAYLLMN